MSRKTTYSYALAPDIYEGDLTCRFVLGRQGANMLYTFGVNPSVADQTAADATINRVIHMAERMPEIDGWVMLNLYPARSTNPDQLPVSIDEHLYERNLEHIKAIIGTIQNPVIWAAWGDLIKKRPYLKKCLEGIARAIASSQPQWVYFQGSATRDIPSHPLKVPYDSVQSKLDIVEYLKNL